MKFLRSVISTHYAKLISPIKLSWRGTLTQGQLHLEVNFSLHGTLKRTVHLFVFENINIVICTACYSLIKYSYVTVLVMWLLYVNVIYSMTFHSLM